RFYLCQLVALTEQKLFQLKNGFGCKKITKNFSLLDIAFVNIEVQLDKTCRNFNRFLKIVVRRKTKIPIPGLIFVPNQFLNITDIVWSQTDHFSICIFLLHLCDQ